MLAYDFTKSPVTSGITQPKLDGIRMVANTRGLYTRSNKEIVSVPHIADALAGFIKDHPTVTLDGELYNHDLKDDFQRLTSLVRKTVNLVDSKGLVQYHIYDMFDNFSPLFSLILLRKVISSMSKQRNTNTRVMLDSASIYLCQEKECL